MFGDYVDRVYPTELKIKVTIDKTRSTSYLEIQLEIGRGALERKLMTKEIITIFPL